jgi:SpoVK/Ycf46/Vps4 family AAA+-type ATPase
MKRKGEQDDDVDVRIKRPRLSKYDPIREAIEQEILDTSTGVTLDNVVGLLSAKQALYEAVICPAINPSVFRGLRSPPKGILLFGPPGNGKTMIAKAVASQVKATFFNISASVLVSKWSGESEKLVRALFDIAREKQPSVIFIDEIDSILTSRTSNEHEVNRRLKTEFLIAFDGVGSRDQDQVLVMAATNTPDSLDEAVRRRFGRRIFIPMPDALMREEIIKGLFKGENFNLSEQEMKEIVSRTEGYSGSDITELCRDVAWSPLRLLDSEALRNIQPEAAPVCGFEDFLKSLEIIKPTVDQHSLAKLVEWNELFGEKMCVVSSHWNFGNDSSTNNGCAVAKPCARMQDGEGNPVEVEKVKIETDIRNAIEQEIMEKSASAVLLEDVIGLATVKQLLFEAVVCPSLNPIIFTGLRSAPKGILLFGPPGNGKTMIAKAVAAECEATFFHISASVLTSKGFGVSEKLVRALFAIAREKRPSVIFIDEIDSILSARRNGENESSR